MIKNLKLLILLNILLILSSCGSLKEGFQNQKKNNSDEFLVQKKSPLVMPPEYGKLPDPTLETKKSENLNSTPIKQLILSKNENDENSIKESDINKSFKQKLLEKIKNN
mgnify:CR=1 FL=1